MSALESGQLVGRYRILRFLGAGAMGEVYVAEDPHIERRLAIKTVRLAGGRPQDIEDRKKRLLREARAAGRLLHPNVVTLFDTGEVDGLLFLAFEFVEGSDLASRLETGPPPTLREVLRITRQVADALDYAHHQGIVHRDIKPSNILIDTERRVKVADFGIAKMVGQSTELTVAGSVMGSPQYLSPEQIRGDDLDGRSDIFSLGVVLYEMLSGHRPFDGETITTLVYQILHKEPAISELRAVPLRIEQLLHRMLAKERDDRISTAALVAEELAAIERELAEETLSAPAAPAAEMLDATRVMPSRSLSGVPLPAGAPGAPPPASPVAAPAAFPGAVPAAFPGVPPAAAGAGLGVAGAGLGAGGSGAAVAPPQPPPLGAAAAAVPGTAAGAFAGAAVPVAPPPPPQAGAAAAPGGGRAKLFLVLAALFVLFCCVVGAGAYWAWQRFMPHLGGGDAATTSAALPATAAGGAGAAGSGGPIGSGATGGAAAGGATGAPGTTGAPGPVTTAQGGAAGAAGASSQAGRGGGTAASGAAGLPSAGGASGMASAGGAASAPTAGSVPPPAGDEPPPYVPPAAPSRPSPPAAGTRSPAADSAYGAAPRTGAAPPVPRPPAAAADRADRGAAAAPGRSPSSSPAVPVEPPPPAPAEKVDRVVQSGLELAFRVNPPDAFVLLDGAVIGRAEEWSGQKGERSFTLPGTGQHLIKVKKSGMKDYRISVEAGATRGVTPVVVNLQPLPAAQVDTPDLQSYRVREAIALRVQPDVNAVVLVDGATVGPAKRFAGRFGHSDEWLSLTEGMHRITVVSPGYARRDLAVEVRQDADKARQKIDVNLVRE